MKSIIFLLIAFISSSVLANPYNGVWYFVEGEYKLEDGSVVTADNTTLTAIKVVNNDKFSLTNTEKGEFLGFLSGDFAVTEDGYVEIVKKATKEEYIGNRFDFEGKIVKELVNDVEHELWHHQGEVNGIHEREVWRRVK